MSCNLTNVVLITYIFRTHSLVNKLVLILLHPLLKTDPNFFPVYINLVTCLWCNTQPRVLFKDFVRFWNFSFLYGNDTIYTFSVLSKTMFSAVLLSIEFDVSITVFLFLITNSSLYSITVYLSKIMLYFW